MNDDIKKAMQQAKSSLEMDGFVIDDYHTELVRKVMEGEISEDEFLKAAMKLARNK